MAYYTYSNWNWVSQDLYINLAESRSSQLWSANNVTLPKKSKCIIDLNCQHGWQYRSPASVSAVLMKLSASHAQSCSVSPSRSILEGSRIRTPHDWPIKSLQPCLQPRSALEQQTVNQRLFGRPAASRLTEAVSSISSICSCFGIAFFLPFI